MELVSKKQYRGRVLAPSPELVGAVVQTLDQIDKLRSDIYRIKALNPQQKLEAYGIKGVVLAGMIPDTERKRSFELYRNSLSGLSIITFDELLAKLKSCASSCRRSLHSGMARDLWNAIKGNPSATRSYSVVSSPTSSWPAAKSGMM
ncbi:hypothetical protein GCM10023067_49630 [Aminobacter aganoensis]|uniref:Shedu protein SduA C-terminal domain-containing protein n=1 Tax=Pseudorhizobium flavum TaxID=1335061 RepID=A0A7W9Z2S7_9HYPH|nr:Shedu anti-phage system protein SduA domain-containing protein [Pseudorhizobium flavum]MBB6182489.1 hypothetical protein [Pseudorhizobium flavum]CAD6630899.1 hypothetical protein RFYW14_04411 [Pseudorhizobium flavum]